MPDQTSDLQQRLKDSEAKSAYLFSRLTRSSQSIFNFDRSFLGHLVKALITSYKLVTLRPQRLTPYEELIADSKAFIAEYCINTGTPKGGLQTRLELVSQVFRFALANPHITLKQMTWFRVKRLCSCILTGDSSQTSSWVKERFPISGAVKQAITLFPNSESLDHLCFSVPCPEQPLVSIIVPVYNQYRMTISCLQSIVANTFEIDYEVILADDCSTDITNSIQERVAGLRVVKTPGNQGFLKNCNLAASSARGEYILLLNNDTNVQADWLKHLLTTIENKSVGLVGPKLLFSDGVLQEAGGIVWQDGSGWNFGRGLDPLAPEFNYTRETDYISGACVMLTRALWEQLGGFDERFVPAYYEDTDLAFSIRALGLKVVYEPKSVVVHFEGVSNGTDLNSGMKKHQVKNQQVFNQKWREILKSEHFPNGQSIFLAKDRSRARNTVLFIDHYVPFFDKDAGSRSTFMYVKSMVELGYNVKFLGANFFPHQPYTQVLQNMGVEVLFGDRFARNWELWLKENSPYIDTIYLHRPHITEDFIESILALKERPKLIYFGHDLHYIRTLREYEVTGDSRLKHEADAWRQREWKIFSKVDLILYPSDEEVSILQAQDKALSVKQLPLYQLQAPPPYSHAERVDLLFVGGFNHTPNVDGILWFVKQIFPLLTDSSIRLHIVGSSAPTEILDLASDRILVHGFVSDSELESLYKECRLVIVPLRYGAGVKGKVLEAMQAGLPIVTTVVGAEGIPHSSKIFAIGTTAQEFADKINYLYDNIQACHTLIKQYKDVIEKYYSEQVIKNFILQNFELRKIK